LPGHRTAVRTARTAPCGPVTWTEGGWKADGRRTGNECLLPISRIWYIFSYPYGWRHFNLLPSKQLPTAPTPVGPPSRAQVKVTCFRQIFITGKSVVSSNLKAAVSKWRTATALSRFRDTRERPAVAADVAPHRRTGSLRAARAEGLVGPVGKVWRTREEAGAQSDRPPPRTAMGPPRGGSTRFRKVLDPPSRTTVLPIIRID
jgi:hypothetical protein